MNQKNKKSKVKGQKNESIVKGQLSNVRNTGSVLVFTIIITGLMMATAISLISVASIERKMSSASGKSTQAMFVADSGAEVTLKTLQDAPSNSTLDSIYGAVNCSGGSVTLPSATLGPERTIRITFYKDENGTPGQEVGCGDDISTIKKIKSVGTYGGTSRAIKAAVPLCNIEYAIGTPARALAFDSITKSIWVAGFDGKIQKRDIYTGSEIGRYNSNNNSGGMTIDDVTDSIWVTKADVGGHGVVGKFNINNGNEVGSYQINGTSAYHIAFDNITDSVWVTNVGSNPSITKININTGAVVGTYLTGLIPSGIAFDDVTESIWVSENDGKVHKLNIHNGNEIGRYGVDNVRNLVFDNKNEYIWVTLGGAGGAGFVKKIDIHNGNEIARYATGGNNPHDIAFDNITDSVWVTNGDSDTVSKIDIYTGAIKHTYTLGSGVYDVVFDDITKSIWVASSGAKLITKICVE